jgi:beta-lactamase class A
MNKLLLFLFGVLAFSFCALGQKKKAEPAATTPDYEQRLRAEVERLSAISGGKLGVTAIHIESGKRFSQHGQEPFPMASSYKIPIALQLFTKIDSGKLSLNDMIEFSYKDLHVGSGMLSERFNWPNGTKPGVALSVRSLLELMLLISDNSATDICLRLAGGPGQVTNAMKRLGINGIRVDRTTSILISDWLGIAWPENAAHPIEVVDSIGKLLSKEQLELASKKFDSDIKDTSTPEAMSQLLYLLHTKPILKRESQDLLLDIMRRCETGQARLKGALPPGTEVKHKTGTIGMTTNDVGIITLPGDAGHVAISVFVKSSEKEIPERERAIAEVTRTLYDYFILMH